MDDYKNYSTGCVTLGKLEKSGGFILNALVNFALQKAEDGKSSNIERDLEEFAKQLFNERMLILLDHKNFWQNQCIQLRRFV